MPNKIDKTSIALITLILIITILTAANIFAQSRTPFDSGKAPFAVQFKNVVSSYRLMSLFAMPGEEIILEIPKIYRSNIYHPVSADFEIKAIKSHQWLFVAPPDAGLYRLAFYCLSSQDSMILNIFVMVPRSPKKGEYLKNYRIGNYPKIPYKKMPIYTPPEGFVEYKKAYDDIYVSPHFKLKQFLCKQESKYPKYLILQEKLLLKLETILAEVNVQGHRCDSFNILSGFRTPYYNEMIGNVKYSRHMWGGAADIFIDENPADDMMDDLNRDGKINWKDAKVLYTIIDNMSFENSWEPYIGGLGRYKKTPSHGPFVHVDVRGRRARWGD